MKKILIYLIQLLIVPSFFLTVGCNSGSTSTANTDSVRSDTGGPTENLNVPHVADSTAAVNPGPANDANVAMTANDFIAKNITDNTHEVHLLQMGRDKGTDAQVKKAAAQMIVDHGQMLKDLQSLAAQRQVTVPAANTNMAHSALPDTKGKEFDQAWASQMVTMHEAKINELQNVLNQTQDPDIRALASKALPKIQKHRDMLLKITSTTTGSTQPQ